MPCGYSLWLPCHSDGTSCPRASHFYGNSSIFQTSGKGKNRPESAKLGGVMMCQVSEEQEAPQAEQAGRPPGSCVVSRPAPGKVGLSAPPDRAQHQWL